MLHNLSIKQIHLRMLLYVVITAFVFTLLHIISFTYWLLSNLWIINKLFGFRLWRFILHMREFDHCILFVTCYLHITKHITQQDTISYLTCSTLIVALGWMILTYFACCSISYNWYIQQPFDDTQYRIHRFNIVVTSHLHLLAHYSEFHRFSFTASNLHGFTLSYWCFSISMTRLISCAISKIICRKPQQFFETYHWSWL